MPPAPRRQGRRRQQRKRAAEAREEGGRIAAAEIAAGLVAGSSSSSPAVTAGAPQSSTVAPGSPGRPACNVCRGPCERPQDHFPEPATSAPNPRRVGGDTPILPTLGPHDGHQWGRLSRPVLATVGHSGHQWSHETGRWYLPLGWRTWLEDLEHRIVVAVEVDEFLRPAE